MTLEELMKRVEELHGHKQVMAGDVLPLFGKEWNLNHYPELRKGLLSLVCRIEKVSLDQANAFLWRLSTLRFSVEAAQYIFKLLKATGKPNITTLTFYAHVARTHHMPEEALAMHDLARELGLKPNIYFYYALNQTCAESKLSDKRKPFEFLAEMKEHGIAPDIKIYLGLMRTCARHGDVTSAIKVMGMVEADGLPYTLPLLTAFANVCSTQSSYAKKGFAVLHLMQQHGITPDLAAYNALLKCCSVVDNISGMQQILQLMREQNMTSDEFSMLSLINGQLVNDNIKAARDIIGNFRMLGVTPSIKTYRLLFAACKRKGDLDAALELWDQMKEEGVEPDTPIFDALMDIYARHGDLDHLHQLLEAIREKGFAPSASNIGWLLAAMSKHEHQVSEAGYQLVEDVRTELGVAPHLATFSMAIDALIKSDRIDEAWAVRRNMMERWQVQPDRVLNRAFLFALAAKSDVDKIDELFRYMTAHPRTFYPHCQSFVLLLEQRFSQDPRSPRAIEVLEARQQLNAAHWISPQLVTKPVLQAIEALMDQNRLDSARKMLRYLRRRDLATYERLFGACTREEHFPMLAEWWTHLMRNSSLTPDLSTSRAYLGALCRCGQVHAAVHLLHTMARKGLAPTVDDYNFVLERADQCQRWSLMRKVLSLMEKSSVSGDSVTAAARTRLRELGASGVCTFGHRPRVPPE